MTTLSLTYPNHLFARLVNTGSSEESRELAQKFYEILLHFRRRAERDQAFLDLFRVLERYNQDSADERTRVAVEQRAQALACRFLNSLPSSISTPEIAVDPDGEVSFDWIISRERQFSVSLSPTGLLSYAGVYGNAATTHGTEEFDDTIPQTIVDAIRRLGLRA